MAYLWQFVLSCAKGKWFASADQLLILKSLVAPYTNAAYIVLQVSLYFLVDMLPFNGMTAAILTEDGTRCQKVGSFLKSYFQFFFQQEYIEAQVIGYQSFKIIAISTGQSEDDVYFRILHYIILFVHISTILRIFFRCVTMIDHLLVIRHCDIYLRVQ